MPDEPEASEALDALSYVQGAETPETPPPSSDDDLEAQRQKARSALYKAAPTAVENLVKVSNGLGGEGAKSIVAASEAILDRAGLPTGGDHVAPSKDLPLAAMAAALMGMAKVMGVSSPAPIDVTPRKKRIKNAKES